MIMLRSQTTTPIPVAIVQNILAFPERICASACWPYCHAGSTFVALMIAGIATGQNRKMQPMAQPR